MNPEQTVREWFADATAAFTEVVDGLSPAVLDRPGLGDWTVRSLIGHTCRSFTTIEEFSGAARELEDAGGSLSAPAAQAIDAVGYFMEAFATVDDADVTAALGVAAGEALGVDAPLDRAHDIAVRGTALVDALPDDDLLLTGFGPMFAIDYLVTRAFEVTVHTLDVCDAVGASVPPRLTEPARHAAAFAAILTVDADAYPVLRALTGRAPLPDGFSCLR